jgi:hypothetical protein
VVDEDKLPVFRNQKVAGVTVYVVDQLIKRSRHGQLLAPRFEVWRIDLLSFSIHFHHHHVIDPPGESSALFSCESFNGRRHDIESQQPIELIRSDIMPIIVSPGYRVPGRIVEIVKFDADRLNLRVGTGADSRTPLYQHLMALRLRRL